MSYAIENLKFTIFGHGHDVTRNDSGDGSIETGAQFYDANGNEYRFNLMPVKIPKAPNTSGNSGNYISGQGYTWSWNSDSSGKQYSNAFYAHFSNYGQTYLEQLREVNALAWDIYENNIWFAPPKLNGFSVRNLIELGVLQDAVGSCRLYKDEPLSDNYIEVEITGRKPDYFRDAVGAYEDVDLTAYSITYKFIINGGSSSRTISYGVDEFDGALCELEKYDGTKGLGMCVQGMDRIPIYEQGGNPSVIRTGQYCGTNDNTFTLLDYFFGDE